MRSGQRSCLHEALRYPQLSKDSIQQLSNIMKPAFKFLLLLERDSNIDLGKLEEPLAEILDMAESKLERQKEEKEQNTAELKPCPFCGSKNIHIGSCDYDGGVPAYYGSTCFYVECFKCHVTTYPDDCFTKQDAIKLWNNRAR